MPAFPERESSLLSKLHESAPWTAKLHQDVRSENQPSPETETSNTVSNGPTQPPPAVNIGMPMEPFINTGSVCVST